MIYVVKNPLMELPICVTRDIKIAKVIVNCERQDGVEAYYLCCKNFEELVQLIGIEYTNVIKSNL